MLLIFCLESDAPLTIDNEECAAFRVRGAEQSLTQI